jgi:phosphoribosyl 1,2-cyclic phosphodiesterase
MRIRVWGCRGSLATPGPGTVGVGGNTSCVEVRPDGGGVVVLDAGTGIRTLGAALVAEGVREIDLLLTHLHLDHVEGLGFFALLFDADCTVRIWGPAAETPLADRLATYLSPPYFPLPFGRLGARIEVVDVEPGTWEVGGLTVTAAEMCHPGPTLGYRLTERGASFVFIPDNEPDLDADAGVALAAGADLLFHDAQFTDEEYASRHGWGHASTTGFATFVRRTAPREVRMFHHDPSHDDERLAELERSAREATGREDVALAREGAWAVVRSPLPTQGASLAEAVPHAGA